jgi:hypothetical protein
LRSGDGRTLLKCRTAGSRSRLGASAGLCSDGTYSKWREVSVARQRAPTLATIRLSVFAELLPLAMAPSTALASTSKTTRCPRRSQLLEHHSTANFTACASRAPGWRGWMSSSARDHSAEPRLRYVESMGFTNPVRTHGSSAA